MNTTDRFSGVISDVKDDGIVSLVIVQRVCFIALYHEIFRVRMKISLIGRYLLFCDYGCDYGYCLLYEIGWTSHVV